MCHDDEEEMMVLPLNSSIGDIQDANTEIIHYSLMNGPDTPGDDYSPEQVEAMNYQISTRGD